MREIDGVQLYSRAEWGARGDYVRPLGTVNKDIWHHFYRPDVPISASVAEEMAVMRAVEAYHISKGWSRISYNFVVFKSGRAYVGCGLNQRGAHTVGQNYVSKAVCFAWDGDASGLTAQALRAAKVIRNYMIENEAITRGSRIFGHRDFAPKSCPGNRVYPDLDMILLPVVEVPEEEFVVTPDSPGYVVRHFQRILNFFLKEMGLQVTRRGETKDQIEQDGDFGPWTNAAWKKVAKQFYWVRFKNRRVSTHDYTELRVRMLAMKGD